MTITALKKTDTLTLLDVLMECQRVTRDCQWVSLVGSGWEGDPSRPDGSTLFVDFAAGYHSLVVVARRAGNDNGFWINVEMDGDVRFGAAHSPAGYCRVRRLVRVRVESEAWSDAHHVVARLQELFDRF